MTPGTSTARESTASQRVAIVAAIFILSVVTYIDRTAISTAKEGIATQLHLSESAMGLVFSAFALGYAGAQIPAGWIADRIGPRRALAYAVMAWSGLTALTGMAWSLASLVTIRFFFGIGEAFVFPGCARVIKNWLPSNERGRANGVLFAGSRIGAAVSFPLLVLLVQRWDWRRGFMLLGAVGILWALFWLMWFRDRPQAGSSEDAESPISADAHRIQPLEPRPRLIAALLLQYFASNFTNFICLSWMFPYLRDTYRISNADAALYSMPPLLMGATALSAMGPVVDRMYRSGWAEWSRRLPAMAGYALSAAGLVAVTSAHTLHASVAAFTLAVFGADMAVGPSWTVCGDVGGKHTGRIAGSMNMVGNIGAFVSANAFPLLHRLTGTASAYFLCAALLNVIAAGCWLIVRSLRILQEPEVNQ